MAELTRLKQKRGVLKRRLTVFNAFLETADPIDDHDEVQMRLMGLENILNDFENIQIEITLIEDVEEHNQYRDDFEESYYSIIRKARKFIKDNAPTLTRELNNTIIDTMNASRDNVRLPKIDLPCFNGAYDQWLCFYDTFKSMIHTKFNISKIEKLHYLRSCLKGEAATITQSLETTEDNYDIAWSLLIERYDNKRVIIQNHLKALLEQPVFTRESATNVRQLLDNINKHTRALKTLGQPVETWDTILIFTMTAKLDKVTHQEWEKSINSRELPTFKEFIAFLTSRCHILEATSIQNNAQTMHHIKVNNTNHSKRVLHISQRPEFCILCKGEHKISSCNQFLKLSPSERLNEIKTLKACFNCLRKNHSNIKCICGPCQKCGKKHHTLLHIERQETNALTSHLTCSNQQTSCDESVNLNFSQQKVNSGQSQILSNPQIPSVTCGNLQTDDTSQVVLATARVALFDTNNKKHFARVILDGGAQAHFISERFANLLKLKRSKIHIPVVAINQMETIINNKVTTRIASTHGNYETNVSLLVVPSVSAPLPMKQINSKNLQIPKNIPLADPSYFKTAEIDALIGAELFYKILCAKQIDIKNEDAVLQKTRFGWIIAGKIKNDNSPAYGISCNLSINSLNNDLSRFWEIEELTEIKFLSQEEAEVEQHYLKNTKRNDAGRYIVQLPFNDNITRLGDSYTTALKRFYALERKLEKCNELKCQYVKFMKDYEYLKHMTQTQGYDEQGYFLPHHAVIKSDSLTTKCRVVFDGSAKTNTGISLNDTLKVGPTIQENIFDILVRFRIHKIAFTADIEKMYRQILVDNNMRQYQKIIWRENPHEPIKIYNLNTITYGTSSAPFLAIRTLHQLADDERVKYPAASNIVKRDFYVDDLLSGCDTFENAIILRDELSNLLMTGGFNLRQWSSNDKRLIQTLPIEATRIDLFKDPSRSIKTLGVHWDSECDSLLYSIKSEICNHERVTKRTVLSKISELFDPIGLLGPVIVKAKLIMQKIWLSKIEWDESLPLNVHSEWLYYKNQLPLLTSVSFERHLLISNPKNIQLHGFCDASESAYGACIYIRSINEDNKCITQLVCSKSKVAPLKSKLTIPKLELCAALLLSKLCKTIVSILPVNFNEIYFWSDSTITLNWINTQPYILKTFVANRVSEIRTLTNITQWKHVPTNDNPADCISRGQTVSEFLENDLWKTGPCWLKKHKDNWPGLPIENVPLFEIRKTTVLKATIYDYAFLKRFSSFNKLIRVIAYCIRFANKCAKIEVESAFLTVNEIKNAKLRIIKLIQNLAFANEINNLSASKVINNKSSLKSLNPFLDKNNIIRVGGRLKHACLSYDNKYPIVLPKANHITDLIIKHEHENSLHAGIQNTLYKVRTQYWPIDGKNATKRIIHSCIKCFRFKKNEIKQIMGNLPENRLTMTRPFLNTGIDYCGPFLIKEKKLRNRNKVKVYVAIFICFATKAVHLEVVSELTTDAFMSCLKRFFSRRGKSKNIYSDNGTNFVGANNELKALYNLIRSDDHNKIITNHLHTNEINWHFIPPRSPHFGGLWESAVKSFKQHFMRTVGNALLTFEEFNTHVIEIEAILNSRPLTPQSNDPNDFTALTPAHFLINDSLVSVPEAVYTDTPTNRLSNWEHLIKLKQHFWTRWHKEYLNELNIRSKWKESKSDLLSKGAMVLLKEDNTSPLHWPLGRIVELHPGSDGVVRVISVKTTNGTFKRSIKKIAVLPIEN